MTLDSAQAGDFNNIQERIVKQVRATRSKALAAQQISMAKRNAKVQEVQANLQEIKKSIQAKHASIRDQLQQDTIHREANVKVSRGLESLEKLIRLLRSSNAQEAILERAIRDPIASGSVQSDRRRIFASDFVRSLLQQLTMQTEFINIAAHELRTPIMPILTNVELLEAELGRDDKRLKRITRSVRRLERLVENILATSRIDGGYYVMNKETFDINEEIASTIDERMGEAENSNIKLIHESREDKIYVEVDRVAISRVISNMLDNAIKFTSEGTITVRVKKVNNEALVSIKDTGTGISREILPILFRKFATHSHKGTGLGLYICKNIVERNGGIIFAVNNSDQKGATFGFALPLARSELESVSKAR